MLVHEYLAQHGEHVSRAFTAASVMPWIERELGIRPPSFWATLSPELQRGLLATLRNRPRDRQVIATAFQRLHFFVLPEKLPKARDDLVRSLAAGDAEAFRKVRRDYQVDAVLAFLNTDVAIPIRVREYEFLAGAGRLAAPRQGEFEPEVEAMFDYALPLIELRRAGRIGAPKWNARRLHHLETQVLVLAGLRDEATDYRSSISLAARYPMGRIVILDDNHVFARSSAGGARRTIERAFLVGGFASIAYQDAEKSIDAYRWKGG